MNNLDIVDVLVLSGSSIWFLAMLLPFSYFYIMDGAFKVEKNLICKHESITKWGRCD